MFSQELTPEALLEMKKQKTVSVISSILISFLAIIFLGLLLYILKIFIPQEEVETIITYKAQIEDVENTVKEKVLPTSKTKPTPPSASAATTNIITSSQSTAISLPDTETVHSIESIDFGEADDFGAGSGFGEEAGTAGAEGFMTAFGRAGGGGLKGLLYDIKQSRRDTAPPRGYSIEPFQARTKKAREKNYEKSSLSEFYKAKVSLSFSYLTIDSTSATLGPEAFNAQNEIQPQSWLVVYDGTLTKDAKRQVKFYGKFDDVLIVYVNDKMVLDASWSPGYTREGRSTGTIEGANKGTYFGTSDYLSLKAGDTIRIVVGEVPGGQMGGGLYISERGVENPGVRRDGKFTHIPFCTLSLTQEDREILKSKRYPMEYRDVPVFPVK